jgi:hypothetical protein
MRVRLGPARLADTSHPVPGEPGWPDRDADAATLLAGATRQNREILRSVICEIRGNGGRIDSAI